MMSILRHHINWTANIIDRNWVDRGEWDWLCEVSYSRDVWGHLAVAGMGLQGGGGENRWVCRRIGWWGHSCSECRDGLSAIDKGMGITDSKPKRGTGSPLLPKAAIFGRQSEVGSHRRRELRLGLSENGHTFYIQNRARQR